MSSLPGSGLALTEEGTKTFQCIPGAVAGYHGNEEVLQLPEVEVGVTEGCSLLTLWDQPRKIILGHLVFHLWRACSCPETQFTSL